MEYQKFKVQIFSADAQASYNDGLIVLVTGCLLGKDNLGRKFTQSFFLAPQDKGYFALNDVFRYVDEMEDKGESKGVVNNKADEIAPRAPLAAAPGSFLCPKLHFKFSVTLFQLWHCFFINVFEKRIMIQLFSQSQLTLLLTMW